MVRSNLHKYKKWQLDWAIHVSKTERDGPFNSHKWPRQNFSLQYQYNINQISDENKENINLGIISWSNTKFSELTL